VAPQDSQICGGNLPKRVRLAASLCQIGLVTIEINFTTGGMTLYPAGMHCPRWQDDAFDF